MELLCRFEQQRNSEAQPHRNCNPIMLLIVVKEAKYVLNDEFDAIGFLNFLNMVRNIFSAKNHRKEL